MVYINMHRGESGTEFLETILLQLNSLPFPSCQPPRGTVQDGTLPTRASVFILFLFHLGKLKQFRFLTLGRLTISESEKLNSSAGFTNGSWDLSFLDQIYNSLCLQDSKYILNLWAARHLSKGDNLQIIRNLIKQAKVPSAPVSCFPHWPTICLWEAHEKLCIWY